jgi:hypothetical protein
MLFSWLSQQGPHATKHHGWAHPISVLLCHYTLLIMVAFGVHDRLITRESAPFPSSWSMTEPCQSFRRQVGIFLALYSLWFLPWRICFSNPGKIPRNSLVYEYTWLCNGTLVLGSLASLSNRPIISSGCCVTVGIDQLLWYVDLIGYYCFAGKFPVGVAKYLTWPETNNALRVTCTHHLWTIPLLMTTSGGRFPVASYILSFLLMVLNVCLSRVMIPAEIVVPITTIQGEAKSLRKYLNVNLSHELWKDIKFELLQINYDDPPAPLYLFRLLWRWQGFNTIVYIVLVLLGRMLFAGDNHICKQ